MALRIDINCDMGEGMGNDAQIMPFITSANIACGYHAGDHETMRQTVALALEYGVHVGAHPSYPDRDNFGRTNMQFSPDEVEDMVLYQIETLATVALREGAMLRHVKPHGALYNMAAQDAALAAAICRAVLTFDPKLLVFGLSGSRFMEVATEMGLTALHEVFSDRTYQKDGTLTPRSQPNALLHDRAAVCAQVRRMVTEQVVLSSDGVPVPVKADTICIHGDGKEAVELAEAIWGL
jgi:5-oxoprolinase (ATP-hydrolysing) subunit A